ncbi:hypothetical protein G9A89_014415 [Geosiphon pyriformis]|nr:hypothetical protein G9A89_014415 [Geosiphon pyriformis]
MFTTIKQTLTTFEKRDQKPLVTFGALLQKQHSNNNFKVATTPETATLEYYQSIYTHCKQRFDISDGIEIVKRTLYLYIENYINNYLLGNYNISEVRSNLYNNLVHYLQLGIENLNINFQKLNFNIIQYCEKNYPQHSSTTLNIPRAPKITAKHLQTPEQRTSTKLPLSQKPISTSTNIIDYLQENENNYSESLESEETESKQEKTSKNKEEMAIAYIAKIPEFIDKDNNTSSQEWLDKVQKAGDANGWNTARMLKTIPYFLQGTTEEYKSVITYLEKFNKLLRRIHQLETNKYYSDAQILNQFIAGLKDKLIKKNYKMAMEEANHTKLLKKDRPIHKEDINHHNDETKTTLDYHPTTNFKIVIIVESQDTGNEIARNCKETNKMGVINNNNNRINSNNQLVSRNSGQQRPNIYHIQPSYLIMPKKSNFQQTALSEDKAVAPRSNSSNNTISSAQIAQNTNLSDIFPFEFEANESLFLLSNAAVNEQKAITVMYTEATVEEKLIQLILDSRSTGTLVRNNWLLKANANLDWKTQELKISYQGQYTIVLATLFEFEKEKKIPLTETYMILGSTSNWAGEME